MLDRSIHLAKASAAISSENAVVAGSLAIISASMEEVEGSSIVFILSRNESFKMQLHTPCVALLFFVRTWKNCLQYNQ
jgi:hypothetical protein